MSIFKKNYKISVCIPVFGTESVLMDCLKSVEKQLPVGNSKDYLEIVVVDDCSVANTAKKIVKEFKKTSNIPVTYIRHEENKGLVEARRTAVYASKGKYIFNLDSDDTLPEKALDSLLQKAEESKAHIVQGKAAVCFGNLQTEAIDKDTELQEKYKEYREKGVNLVYEGELINKSEDNQILNGYLINKNHMGYLWGKLFLRETYLDAFNHIPPIFCTMCEDIIQYVWLCYEAKKYVSISNVVYNYSVNTGISSRSVIKDMGQWERVCSTSGVFTALYGEFDNPEVTFTKEQKDAIRQSCIYHLSNNIIQLRSSVIPELQDEAYAKLCDYWGKSFVEKIESNIKE